MSKLFTVFGATGQQGGALISYLLSHPRFSKTFKLRGVTRDASKSSAKILEAQGVEIVEVTILFNREMKHTYSLECREI